MWKKIVGKRKEKEKNQETQIKNTLEFYRLVALSH